MYPYNFKAEKDGQKTGLYILKTIREWKYCVTNLGGTRCSIMVPDKEGVLRDVVLDLTM
jgi:aldose 1-epimerase